MEEKKVQLQFCHDVQISHGQFHNCLETIHDQGDLVVKEIEEVDQEKIGVISSWNDIEHRNSISATTLEGQQVLKAVISQKDFVLGKSFKDLLAYDFICPSTKK